MAEAKLTLFFIVEPPLYEELSCYLAASIRQQFSEPVKLIGYCPAHKMDALNPAVLEILHRLDVDLRPMQTEGRFEPAYPHGNKILACLEPKETAFAGFMDSDILCLRPNRIENLISEGQVSLTPAASIYWMGQHVWKDIYGACEMEIPEERIMLMRQKSRPLIPYFSSGLVVYPEGPQGPDGKRFAQTWMDIAQIIDGTDGIERKRPYLDQMTLPLAIQKAGLTWNLLPEEQHFILGGKLRGEPFPRDREIFTVHYRGWPVLRENNLARLAKRWMASHGGARRIKDVVLEDS